MSPSSFLTKMLYEFLVWEDSIKMYLKEIEWVCGLDSSDSGMVQVSASEVSFQWRLREHRSTSEMIRWNSL